MNIKKTLTYIFLLGLISSIGCFQQDFPAKESLSSISSADFNGLNSVKNVGQGFVELTWNLASSDNIKAYRIYEKKSSSKLELLVEKTNSDVKHLFNGIAPGVHTYLVKAVDLDGVEDSNKNYLSTIVYYGIKNVSSISYTSAQIEIEDSGGAADEIRIYAAAKRDGVLTRVGTITTGETSVLISNLKSGTTYNFYARAFSKTLALEEANTHSLEAQTSSYSFADASFFGFQGVSNVVAYGDAPNAVVGPSKAQVNINWVKFLNLSGGKYKVIRTLKGLPIETYTKAACETTTDASCLVAEVPDTGADSYKLPTFDNKVATPEARNQKVIYNYTIAYAPFYTDISDFWVEEPPSYTTEKINVEVPIPPKYMVLAHRAAINYEMCYIYTKTIEPRHDNRCKISNLQVHAGVPKNSGPGKPNFVPDGIGYFDFGYSIFLDRWDAGLDITDSQILTNHLVNYSANDVNPAYDVNQERYKLYNLDNATKDFAVASEVSISGLSQKIYFMKAGIFSDNSAYHSRAANCWSGSASCSQALSSNMDGFGRYFIKTSGSDPRLIPIADWGNNLITESDRNFVKSKITYNPKRTASSTRSQVAPLRGITQLMSSEICSSQTTAYGNKRLYRAREYAATSSRPYLNEDLSMLSLTYDPLDWNSKIRVPDLTNPLDGECNTSGYVGTHIVATSDAKKVNWPWLPSAGPAVDTGNSYWGGTIGAVRALVIPTGFFTAFPTAQSMSEETAIGTFFRWNESNARATFNHVTNIGSHRTRKCLSRYGAQDFIGNQWKMTSNRRGECNTNSKGYNFTRDSNSVILQHNNTQVSDPNYGSCLLTDGYNDTGNTDLSKYKLDSSEGFAGKVSAFKDFKSLVTSIFGTSNANWMYLNGDVNLEGRYTVDMTMTGTFASTFARIIPHLGMHINTGLPSTNTASALYESSITPTQYYTQYGENMMSFNYGNFDLDPLTFKSIIVGGAFEYSISARMTSSMGDAGVRCVLEAE